LDQPRQAKLDQWLCAGGNLKVWSPEDTSFGAGLGRRQAQSSPQAKTKKAGSLSTASHWGLDIGLLRLFLLQNPTKGFGCHEAQREQVIASE